MQVGGATPGDAGALCRACSSFAHACDNDPCSVFPSLRVVSSLSQDTRDTDTGRRSCREVITLGPRRAGRL
eukprot:scaffold43694_cov61-Phaeocystis_antarctica.AAC.3